MTPLCSGVCDRPPHTPNAAERRCCEGVSFSQRVSVLDPTGFGVFSATANVRLDRETAGIKGGSIVVQGPCGSASRRPSPPSALDLITIPIRSLRRRGQDLELGRDLGLRRPSNDYAILGRGL